MPQYLNLSPTQITRRGWSEKKKMSSSRPDEDQVGQNSSWRPPGKCWAPPGRCAEISGKPRKQALGKLKQNWKPTAKLKQKIGVEFLSFFLLILTSFSPTLADSMQDGESLWYQQFFIMPTLTLWWCSVAENEYVFRRTIIIIWWVTVVSS